MTLLSMAQDIAREIGTTVPGTIVGNSDLTAVRLLAAASRAGKWLAKRHTWAGLIREHTITTVASTASYALPTDYDRYIDDTAWDRTNYWAMRGGASPAEWQYRKSGLISTAGLRKRFRVKYDTANSAKRIYIDPTPTAVETLVLEYLSTSWCESAAAAAQSDWVADTDVGRLDEYLLQLEMHWRFLKSLGQPYAEEHMEAKEEIAKAVAYDQPNDTKTIGGGSLDDDFSIAANLPDTGYGL